MIDRHADHDLTCRRTVEAHPDASADAKLQAAAIMTAGCFIAQAITEAAKQQRTYNSANYDPSRPDGDM